MLKKFRGAEFKALKAEDGASEPGTFTAVVAVYDNVDSQGDRIKSGAFDETLEAWRKSGDPIPIVLAHEWNDPFAHIGYAMPDKVKSVPGKGLVVEEGHLDIEDNPTARQVYRLMERRTLKEFSFGYSVKADGETRARDGAYDLTNLDLIEFGPCLKGVNDQTELLAIKSELESERRRELGQEPTLEERILAVEAKLEGKAYVELAGTFEERQQAIRDAVAGAYAPADGNGWASVEGTYTDHVVFCVYEDEERKAYRADYSIDADGNVSLGEATEVELTASVVAKAEDEPTGAALPIVETKAEDTFNELEAELGPEPVAEKAVEEDGEKAACPECGKVEQTFGQECEGCGTVISKEEKADEEPEAKAITPDLNLMIYESAIDNLEASAGVRDVLAKGNDPTDTLTRRMDELEDELA